MMTEQETALSEEEILQALARGGSRDRSRERIRTMYAEDPDKKKALEFLRKEYGSGGYSVGFADGTRGFADYDSRGMRIRNHATGAEARLTWSAVEKRLRQLAAENKLND